MEATKMTARRRKPADIENILERWLDYNLENASTLTYRQIAEQTGLPKTTVHRYFPRLLEKRIGELKFDFDKIELPDPIGVWVVKALYAKHGSIKTLLNEDLGLTEAQVRKCLKQPPMNPLELGEDPNFERIILQRQLWRDIENNKAY